MAINITTPLTQEKLRALKSGDAVLLTGEIYTARDAVHNKLSALAAEGKPMPFPIENSIVYYVGPTPEKPGQVIGSAGPTTSSRMDEYSPVLIKLGQTGMIGKGKRTPEVVNAMKEHGAVYFGAIGGCGALLANYIKSSEIVAYEELGAEAIRCLKVEDFPLVVIIDSEGKNLYETGPNGYLATQK
jgi:fumarate hydratase subunit beta